LLVVVFGLVFAAATAAIVAPVRIAFHVHLLSTAIVEGRGFA